MDMDFTGNRVRIMVCVVGFAAQTCAAGEIPDVSTIFQEGRSKTIEIFLPKEGFIGAPSSAFAPHGDQRGKPEHDDDFDKRYIRISIFEVLKIDKGFRISLRLDEVDVNGTVVPFSTGGRRGTTNDSGSDSNKPGKANSGGVGAHEPLFHAYFYITNAQWAVVASRGFAHGRETQAEPGMPRSMGTINTRRAGFPFPLTLTCPPAMAGSERLKENSGLHGPYGRVFMASDDVIQGENPRKKVQAVLFKRVFRPDQFKAEDIWHYSEDQKSLSRDDGGTEVIITAKETQIWKKEFDWLWLTMERTDAQGNILMRCRQVK
jgi:hypothetical protein